MTPEFVARLSPSEEVTVTVKAKSASESAAGVICNPVRSPSDKVQVPFPLSVPAFSDAPVGTPSMTIPVIASESSVTPGVITRSIAVSSVPDASTTVMVGVSATPVTSTLNVVVEVADVPSSEVVVVIVREKSLSSLAAG